jgi:hypothetical protein
LTAFSFVVVKIGDFLEKDKAKKRFLFKNTISPLTDVAKLIFLSQLPKQKFQLSLSL